MRIVFKKRDAETGEVTLDATLNNVEHGYLIQYAVNALMINGVMFENLEEQSPVDEDGNEVNRLLKDRTLN